MHSLSHNSFSLSHYEVLSDPENHEIYDQYGEATLKEGMGGGRGAHDPFDIFSSFFGGGGSPFGVVAVEDGGRGVEKMCLTPSRSPWRTFTVEHLRSKKLSLPRNVTCSKCSGKGSKFGASMKCASCQGTGMKVSIRHLGPSMIQQMQHACNEFKGTRETINKRDHCSPHTNVLIVCGCTIFMWNIAWSLRMSTDKAGLDRLQLFSS